ncbi:MBL fold metallo-hydrolase [Lewinella cohaerens]|uniref:MBL fold metallo-hydrolase n=1 Tax=Lewinella cohaerens TaxID=70995 RepID=UPI00037463F1|nr:MBL fold metallo-hydrolase [Lewinella cohaerens]
MSKHLFTYHLGIICLSLVVFSCTPVASDPAPEAAIPSGPYVIVLGIAQDAGYPQTACRKECCTQVWEGQEQPQKVSCLGLVDPVTQQLWLLDATPDFREQWQLLSKELPNTTITQPSGVFLTHAHLGHYTGLLQLGREVMGAQAVPVYAMPRLDTFLRSNGPWSQLVNLGNIALQPLKSDSTLVLNGQLKVTPVQVPHRDEYSETVGFRVEGPGKSLLFIPDIDKWDRWHRSLSEEIAAVDIAFLDATFFADGELPNRDMSKIPHPFVSETMDLLGGLPSTERQKVHFIHLNHTNPLLQTKSPARQEVAERGFQVAFEGQRVELSEK